MVAELIPNLAVRDDCPKCGGSFTEFVLPLEKAKCIDCGFRLYEETWSTEPSGEGRRVRIRYKGDVESCKRLKPMVAIILPCDEKSRPSRLRLGIMCPMCRGIGELSMMRPSKGCKDRWICGIGHSLRLHREDGLDLVGWS